MKNKYNNQKIVRGISPKIAHITNKKIIRYTSPLKNQQNLN